MSVAEQGDSVFGQSGAGNNWAKGHYTEGELMASFFGSQLTRFQVPSSSTPCLMSYDEKPKVATACKVSRLPTRSEVVLDPVWERSSSQRFEKNTRIG